MSRVCHSCERSLRKGGGRRAMVLNSEGKLSSGIVCKRCALRALAFVVPPATTIPTLCVKCKRANSQVCHGCYHRLESHVRELSKANVMIGGDFLLNEEDT